MIIEKRKWDGSVSARWTADFARHGDRVVWTTPIGTVRERPRRGGAEVTRLGEVSASRCTGWIVTALQTADRQLVRYEVDATAGGEAERDGVFAFVDLDLDLEIEGDTTVVKDLIEFVERRALMGYPPDLLRRAAESLEEARLLHARARWPFDGSLLGCGRGLGGGPSGLH